MTSLAKPQCGRQAVTPQVRFAESADIPRLFSLKWQLAIAERITATLCATEADWYREGFGRDGRFAALVAEIDGRLVGMLTLHERCDAQYQSTLYIEDLFVEPPYRNLGVASALLADLAAHARERNIPRIELQVRRDNRAAQRLYRTQGFERRHGIIAILAGDALLACAKAAKRVSAVAVRQHREPIPLRVRPAGPDDVACLCDLKRRSAMADEPGRATCPTADDWIRDGLGAVRPRCSALVAEHEAAIVGVLTYSLRYYTALPRPALAVLDLCVDPAYRRQAIGSSLMSELCAIVSEHHYVHIELHLERHNTAAAAMSRKLGFVRARNCGTYRLAGSPLLRLAEAAANAVSLC